MLPCACGKSLDCRGLARNPFDAQWVALCSAAGKPRRALATAVAVRDTCAQPGWVCGLGDSRTRCTMDAPQQDAAMEGSRISTPKTNRPSMWQRLGQTIRRRTTSRVRLCLKSRRCHHCEYLCAPRLMARCTYWHGRLRPVRGAATDRLLTIGPLFFRASCCRLWSLVARKPRCR